MTTGVLGESPSLRVVVIGPASWNTLVQVPALPDPRPQTLFATDSWSTLGGTSAGKALHLADLGLAVTLGTVLGRDDDGKLIRHALSHRRIRLVAESARGPSERHLNLMAGGDRLSIYLTLPSPPGEPLPDELRDAIEEADHVVLDLSARARGAIPLLRSSAALVWTDLHDYDGESEFHQPFVDAADMVFLSGASGDDPRPLMERIFSGGKQVVVCTLGARGAIALADDGWHEVEAAPATVVDSNGAGDAFLAGFLSAYTSSGAQEPLVLSALRAGTTQAETAVGSRHLSPLLDS